MGQRGFGRNTVDGGGPDTPPTARWLAFAAACLLIAAMVSAGVVGFGDGSSSDAVVAAAGRTTATEPVPSTVTVPPPSTIEPASPTSSTIRTTTTLPRAAVEVLRAIGTTAPPTTAPSPTAPPTTATTVRPSTTTTTAAPRVATVTVSNAYSQIVVVTVNGQPFELEPRGTTGPVQVTLPATGDDVIQVRVRDVTGCDGESRADFFQP
ncbi:MAG: hypothetical protein M3163_07460, partial [Actinomycetota bacterium]|nr:hypothetical protein [Actinomycetota bacterium]